MGNPAEEKRVFEGFLAADPHFAGSDVADWLQPKNDPPDIECTLADGRKIGIELTSWLEESQIGKAKARESLENTFRDAIRPEPPNNTEHIHFLWLFPKRRMAKTDAATFRAELLRLTEEIDRRWGEIYEWHTPQGFYWREFTNYPMLGRYLESVDVHPRRGSGALAKGNLHWLTFPLSGGAYSPDWMVDALCEVVEAKIAHYSQKPPGCDEFHLLVHYDKALLYNTPVLGIEFGYAEAVQASAARIGTSIGVFDRILVFVPIAEGARIFSLYP